MSISSRTPEGQPSLCPLCGAEVVVEPSSLFGDATCPICGSLLWYLNFVGDQPRVFDRDRSRGLRERVIAIIAGQLGVDADQISEHTLFLGGRDTD